MATENCEWLLFNLNDDPYEQMNMAYITNYRPILKALNDRLAQWLKDTGDDFPLPKIEASPSADMDWDCFGNGHYKNIHY